MSSSNELKKIKKMYGENFMKLCRELFPTILEQEGLLTDILTKNFAGNSRDLYDAIVHSCSEEEFKDFIFSKVDVEHVIPEMIADKDPFELMDEAGYVLTECLTQQEIDQFKKYYKRNEALCTFNGGRLNKCLVFFAVRKDVDRIRRENFKQPRREDAYGTSVLGIQFTRSLSSNVHILNRYNHSVNNPDATYGNDLDRITPGLTSSFSKLLAERGMQLDTVNIDKLDLQSYIVASDGRYYKFNYEINGIYYCPGNIIINHGEVIKLEPEKQELIDYFILDKEKKTLTLYDPNLTDSFVDGLTDIERIDITINKEDKTKTITVKTKTSESPIEIVVGRDNQILKYKNNNLTEIDDVFLYNNTNLEELEIKNVKTVGDYFLYNNSALHTLKIDNVITFGNNCLTNNDYLEELNAPNLIKVGDSFCYYDQRLNSLNIDKIEEVGNEFLYYSNFSGKLSFKNLREVGDKFLGMNRILEELEAPNLVIAGDEFCANNDYLKKVYLPNIKMFGDSCFFQNRIIDEFKANKLEEVGEDFLFQNNAIKIVNFPNLRKIGRNFMAYNAAAEKVSLPKLEDLVSTGFFLMNKTLKKIQVPKGVKIGRTYYDNPRNNVSNIEFVFTSEDTNEKGESVSKEDIAILSKDNEITEEEISWGKRLFNKIKNFFSKKEKQK